MACANQRTKMVADASMTYLSANPTATDKEFFADYPQLSKIKGAKDIFKLNKEFKMGDGINNYLMESVGLKFAMYYTNQQTALKQVFNLMRNRGIAVREDLDAYIKSTLAKQVAVAKHEVLIEWQDKFFKRTTKRLGLKAKEIEDYWVAKGAKSRNARGREVWKERRDTHYAHVLSKLSTATNPGVITKLQKQLTDIENQQPPLMKAGMVDSRAQFVELKARATATNNKKLLKEFAEGNIIIAEDIINNPKYAGKEQGLRDAHTEFKENVIDAGTDALLDGRVIDQEVATSLKNNTAEGFTKLDWYLPLQVDKSHFDDTKFVGSPAGGTTVKNLTGGEGFVINKRHSPTASAMAWHLIRQSAGQNNKTKIALGKFFTENPDSDVKVQGLAFDVSVKADGSVFARPFTEDRNNSVRYYEDGKLKIIKFNPMDGFDMHPLVYAFNHTSAANDFTKALGKFNSYYRSIFTNKNPFFGPVNFMKDMITASINIEGVKNLDDVKGVRKAYFGEIRNLLNKKLTGAEKARYEALREEAEANGAFINFSEYVSVVRDLFADYDKSLSPKAFDVQIAKTGAANFTVDQAKKLGKALDAWSDYFENVNRLAIYSALRKKGLSAEKAAFHARELTLNFERKGGKIADISQLYLFINAGIQDVRKAGEIIYGRGEKTVKIGGKRIPIPNGIGQKLIASTVSLGFMTRALALMLNDEEDEDILQDEFKTDNYFTLPMGFVKEGASLTIPKPYTVFRAPFSLGEHLADVAFDKKNFSPMKAMGIMFGTVMKSVDPIGASDNFTNIAPFITRPLFQAMVNKNWAGSEILDSWTADDVTKKTFDKYYPNTRETSKAISEAAYALGLGTDNSTNILAPVVIDYLWDQYIVTGVLRDLDKLALAPFDVERKGGGQFKDVLDFIIYSAGGGELQSIKDEGVQIKDIPVAKRFITIDSENKNKTSMTLKNILNNNSKTNLSAAEYRFVVRQLKEVNWDDRKINRYKTEFQKAYGERIKELGLRPLRKLDKDGKVKRK